MLKLPVIVALGLIFGCQSPSSKDDAPQADSALTETDISSILGPAAEGWEPPLLRGLKSGMTPNEAREIIAGADLLDDKGQTARIAVDHPQGVSAVKLQYALGGGSDSARLAYGSLVFSESASAAPGFYDALRKACVEKFGPPEDASEGSSQVVWRADRTFAQLLKDGGYGSQPFYVLTVNLPPAN